MVLLKYKFGDWGLGIGDWGLPNPQSPSPNKLYNLYYLV